MTGQAPGTCPNCGFPHGPLADLLAQIIERAVSGALSKLELSTSLPTVERFTPTVIAGAAVPSEPSGDGGGSELNAPEHTARSPAESIEADTGRKPDSGGRAVTSTNTPEPGDIDPADVRQELADWLTRNKCSITVAIVKNGLDLGASRATLYNLISGKKAPKQATLAAIRAALKKLPGERKAGPLRRTDPVRSGALLRKRPKTTPAKDGALGTYKKSQVQKLATTWPPDKGINPKPTYEPPPRCGKAP